MNISIKFAQEEQTVRELIGGIFMNNLLIICNSPQQYRARKRSWGELQIAFTYTSLGRHLLPLNLGKLRGISYVPQS